MCVFLFFIIVNVSRKFLGTFCHEKLSTKYGTRSREYVSREFLIKMLYRYFLRNKLPRRFIGNKFHMKTLRNTKKKMSKKSLGTSNKKCFLGNVSETFSEIFYKTFPRRVLLMHKIFLPLITRKHRFPRNFRGKCP